MSPDNQPAKLDLDQHRRGTMTASLRKLVATMGIFVAMGLAAVWGCNRPAAKPPTAVEVEIITPAKFQETWNDDKLGLLKFGATWCPPCVRTDKEIDKLCDELGDDVNVLKIDVDANPQLAAEFEIGPIPHLVLVKGGEIIDDQIGGMSKAQIQAWIDEHR